MKKFLLAVSVLTILISCVNKPQPVQKQEEPGIDPLDSAIREASDYLNKNIPEGNKVVILNVESLYPVLSEYIIDELIANAVNDKIFKVVDRQQLDLIRAEQNFQLSGEVDDNAALAIGKFLGAQTIVSGDVTSLLRSGYRIRIRALNVLTAEVQGQFNKNINASRLTDDLAQQTQTSPARSAAASSSSSTASAARLPPETMPPVSEIPALQPGASVTGQIAPNVESWYSVRYANNGVVTVETTGSTDTYMQVYNSSYIELAANDDGGSNNNAAITLPVSANQTYYFRVKGFRREFLGYFSISAVFVSVNEMTTLQIGSSLQGNIAALGEYWYIVRPANNGTLTVETSGSTDTFMIAYSMTAEMAFNDDGGAGSNAKISIPVNAGQTYYFQVMGHRGNITGPYEISASIGR